MPKPMLKTNQQAQQSSQNQVRSRIQAGSSQALAASLLSAVREERLREQVWHSDMLQYSDVQQQNRLQQKDSLQEEKQRDKMLLDRLLRKPRSEAYRKAMTELDAGGHVHNEAKIEEIIRTIQQEFPEVELSGVLVGIVSICYLGEPYEVHSLSLEGNILEHYQRGQAMPGRLEKARGIALRGGYQFIEVYQDCFRAVSGNGSVAVIVG